MLLAFLGNVRIPVTVALAAIASLGYLVSRSRHGGKRFTLFDGMAIVLLMGIVSATSVPLLEAAAYTARHTALMQNLYTLRSQIEHYRLEHGGEAPVLVEDTLPQLLHRTDASGTPGQSASRFPYGPYLPKGIPVNPVTGRSVITASDSFPPPAASGNGGWLYHEATGQIAADLPEALDR
jgi:type II secretory pathway pseudopilin PulG